jgi:hypothetical protein
MDESLHKTTCTKSGCNYFDPFEGTERISGNAKPVLTEKICQRFEKLQLAWPATFERKLSGSARRFFNALVRIAKSLEKAQHKSLIAR